MEKVLKLYKYIDGVNDTPFPSEDEQVIVTSFRYDAKRMGGAPTIEFTTMHRLCLDSSWDDKVYAMFNGERYFVKQTPTSSYSSSDTRYKHEVELVSERFVLDNVYFYDTVSEDESVDKPVSHSSKFSFYGDVSEYVSRLDKSLSSSKVGYSVVLDDGVTSEESLVSFENQVITSALQEIHNVYNIPYYFVGKVIHVGYYKDEIDEVFKYGFDNSLISISKQNANSKIINRITGVGSSDNIPYYYPNDDERGITRALLNGQPNMVEIVNLARYRKLRLSNELKYYGSIQSLVPLVDRDDLNISNIKNVGVDEATNLNKYIIQFYYPFSLSSPENVKFNVVTTNEETELIRYEIIRDNNQRFGYFDNEQTIYLTSGSYNLMVTWTFRIDAPMLEVDEYTKNFITLNVDITSDVIVEASDSWTLNGLPIQLSTYGLSVNSQTDGDVITFERVSYIQPQPNLMPPIYRNTEGDERFYEAKNNTYINSETGEYYVFENEYSPTQPREHIEDFDDIKPTIKNVTNASGFRIDRFVDFAYDEQDSDETDENGNFYHPYFFAKLNKTNGSLGFNLFEHSIDESDMTIAMTSGSCGSCEFVIGVDEKTQKNTVQVDEYGNLLRDSKGNVRFGTPQDRQNDTENYEVWVALRKDLQTFGVLMPNASNRYRPSVGDTFVILHIELPKPYVEAAEKKLEESLLKYMSDNNAEKFNFSISFSRIFFAENPSILERLSENSKLKIEYDGNVYELYASSLSYSMTNDSSLPEVKVELNDAITISQNQISQVVSSAKKSILSSMKKDVFWGDIKGIPSWITSEPPTIPISGIEDVGSSFWKLVTTENGEKYLFTEFDVVTQKGITMYSGNATLNLPSIYDGLPIDNTSIYWEETANEDGSITKVLKAKGGSGEGNGTISNVSITGTGNAITDVSLSSDKKSLSFVKGLTFVDKTFLSENYFTRDEASGLFVTLDKKEQEIIGVKTFLNGLKIGSSKIWQSQEDVIYLDANLVVRGGVTMYAQENVDIPSFMESLLLDENTLKLDENGHLTVIGGTGGSIEHALTWSGFSTGSYDGKSAQNIYIPSKVSELTNDSLFATQSWVNDKLDDYVTELGLESNGKYDQYLTYTKGGTVNRLTVGYATYANRLLAFGATDLNATGVWNTNIGLKSSWFASSASNKPATAGTSANGVITFMPATSYGFQLAYLNQLSTGYDSITHLYVRNYVNGSYKSWYRLVTDGPQMTFDTYAGGYMRLRYLTQDWYYLRAYSDGLWIGLSQTNGININSAGRLHTTGHINVGTIYTRGNIVLSDHSIYFSSNVSSGSSHWRIIGYGNGLQFNYADYTGDPETVASYTGVLQLNSTRITAKTDFLCNGGITMYSDERKKTILRHVELSLKEVADAPLIEHYYNSDDKKTTHVGSIAQYWAGLNNWFCKKDDNGFYTMEIQNAALASSISVAREVVRLKERIRELEKEIERFKTA